MWDKPQALNALSNLLYGLVTLAILYTGIFLVVNSGMFPLKEIRVEGKLAHISREQVQYIAKHSISGSFFTLGIDSTRQSFEKLPWVRQVNVRRRWPGMLQVQIEEHKAIARWGDTALVNTSGEVFDATTDEELPIFVGPEGTSHEIAQAFQKFSSLLKVKKLVPVKLEMSARRAWRVTLSNGMLLVLGRDDVDERLHRFVSVYDKSLAGRAGIQYVDLRYANGLAIKLPTAALAAAIAPAKPGQTKAGVPVVPAGNEKQKQKNLNGQQKQNQPEAPKREGGASAKPTKTGKQQGQVAVSKKA
ncbi:cell division protein FtsQ/DivIB [Leeia sp. TBRC 13508]|uniref:Cell division protein FtsQ n=1 Tax=Leeia speluncae TaxID=2884804 RepID=A0ABS8D5N7_9NEIS|nr:cell division protein FtsQ/DivIB [Leeia speluncae]MCB6183499.1 cell division protein FtsQ/DivIB [Leeia speluncae]